MENREAINWLTRIRDRLMTTSSKQFEALTFAIAALEQQEKAFDEWCTDCKEYDHNRNCCPRYNRVIRGAVDEVKQQGWIPCSERLPSAQPERTCVNCGRTVNNGGWYADGRTRCPIEEHYALPKDGYCHLWEKRSVTDDDYPERREDERPES